jgi:hypothetical protein
VDKAPSISYIDDDGNNQTWDDDDDNGDDPDLNMTQVKVRIYNSSGEELLERIIMKRRY